MKNIVKEMFFDKYKACMIHNNDHLYIPNYKIVSGITSFFNCGSLTMSTQNLIFNYNNYLGKYIGDEEIETKYRPYYAELSDYKTIVNLYNSGSIELNHYFTNSVAADSRTIEKVFQEEDPLNANQTPFDGLFRLDQIAQYI